MKQKLTAIVLCLMFILVGCSNDNDTDKTAVHNIDSNTTVINKNKQLYMNSTSDVYKDLYYEYVVDEIKSIGFTNVKAKPIYDLTSDDLDGNIIEVLVEGDSSYSLEDAFSPDVSIVVSYHSYLESGANELGDKDTTENTTVEKTTKAKTTTTKPKKDIVITPDNNKEFSTMLSVRGDFNSEYSVFAKKYEDKTIEFDGCIVYVANHNNYNTRYDILLSSGDYINADTANPGPTFKFEDVNTFDLGISELYLPDYIEAGSNVHIKAKVIEFNSNTGLFFLDPILVKER